VAFLQLQATFYVSVQEKPEAKRGYRLRLKKKPVPKGSYMLRLNKPEAKNVARNFKKATNRCLWPRVALNWGQIGLYASVIN